MVFFHHSSEMRSSQDNNLAASEAGGAQPIGKKRHLKAAFKDGGGELMPNLKHRASRFNIEVKSDSSQPPVSLRPILARGAQHQHFYQDHSN